MILICKCGAPRDPKLKAALCRECSRKWHREFKKTYRKDPAVKAREKDAHGLYREANRDVLRSKDRLLMHRKQLWLNSLKEKPCSDCCLVFPACCMDFDHVRGEKTKGIGQLLGCSREVILAEIAKCDLVCACCHRVRTHPDRQSSGNPHRRRYYTRIDAFKVNPCADCKGSFLPVAMDFDHVRGEKLLTIAQMRAVSWGKVSMELVKCDLVCANCHRIRTQSRKAQEAA